VSVVKKGSSEGLATSLGLACGNCMALAAQCHLLFAYFIELLQHAILLLCILHSHC
jgi:hypothetical protein